MAEETSHTHHEPDRSLEASIRIPVEKWLKAVTDQFGITTFCEDLDTILQGGIHVGCMTEIFGDKSVGKTTLSMELCIAVQLPRSIEGLESEAIFIDTEHTFVVSRLKQMIYGCIQYCKCLRKNKVELNAESLFNGIQVVQCSTLEELRRIVLDLDSYLSSHPKIKLIVVDSLAFLYYADPVLSSSTGAARNKSLYYFAQEFNRLINKYGIAVVLTNNTTTRFGKDTDSNNNLPYLGPSWPYIPHVRLELRREKDFRQAVLHKTFGLFPVEYKALFQIRTPGIRWHRGLE